MAAKNSIDDSFGGKPEAPAKMNILPGTALSPKAYITVPATSGKFALALLPYDERSDLTTITYWGNDGTFEQLTETVEDDAIVEKAFAGTYERAEAVTRVHVDAMPLHINAAFQTALFSQDRTIPNFKNAVQTYEQLVEANLPVEKKYAATPGSLPEFEHRGLSQSSRTSTYLPHYLLNNNTREARNVHA